jgi:hypothetical protein
MGSWGYQEAVQGIWHKGKTIEFGLFDLALSLMPCALSLLYHALASERGLSGSEHFKKG